MPSKRGGFRKGSGRKPTWQQGACKAIKIPVTLVDDVVAYARRLDAGENSSNTYKASLPVDSDVDADKCSKKKGIKMCDVFNHQVNNDIWAIYNCAPIDFNWDFCVDLFAYLRGEREISDDYRLSHLIESWTAVVYLLTKLGLTTPIKEVKILPIPMPSASGEFEFGFVVKQDKSGVTWVVSPVALPWLESDGTRVKFDTKYDRTVHIANDGKQYTWDTKYRNNVHIGSDGKQKTWISKYYEKVYLK